MIERGMLLADRYRIDHRLGAGGMAEVWRAEDLRLGRDVAVKVLRHRDEALARRLRRESRVLAGLAHRAVVAVFDAGELDGHPFLVLELVPGETLAVLLERDGARPPDQVAALAANLADGLAHAHVLGVVHRDVKPSNILVDGDGRSRLVDFGIARSDDGTRLTSTGLSLGTAAYLAPEQLDAPDQVGPAADVYSLGLVLAEALTGQRVFPGPAPAAALARLRTEPSLADVPETWIPLLRAMTRRDPDARPDAASVVISAHELATGAEPTATAVPAATTEPVTAATPTAAMPATVPVAAGPGSGLVAGDLPAIAGPAGPRRWWLVPAVIVAVLGLGLGLALATRGEPGGVAVDGGETPEPPPATVSPPASPSTNVPPTTVATAPPVTEATDAPRPRGGRDERPKPGRGSDRGPDRADREADDDDDDDD